MKKLIIVSVIALVLFASGCVVSEEMVHKSMEDMKEMGRNLDEFDSLVSQNNYVEADKKIKISDELLKKIGGAITEAEEMGEEPEIIDRLKKSSNYLQKGFEVILKFSEINQNIQETTPLMDKLDGGTDEDVKAAIDGLNKVITGIEEVEVLVSEMQSNANLLHSDDSNILNAGATMQNMQNLKNQFKGKYNEFQNMKTTLEA